MRAAQHEARKREALNLRIKPQVRELIDQAAELAGKNRTDFVLDAARRAAEDTLAADLTARGAHVIPSYTVLQDYGGKTDADAAGTQLKQAGAQGVVIMRVVGKEQQVTYTPGTTYPAYYGGFGPYWGSSWGAAYDPGYLRTDTMVSIETLIYSLNSGKLLWASTSRTTNPENVGSLVKEVADATAKEMAKQGLLAP